MVSEVRVRDGDSGGAHNSVDETILALRHRNVVKPNVCCSKNRDTISISSSPLSKVVNSISNETATASDDVVDMKPMNDDIVHILYRDTGAVCDVHVSATSIDRLVTINHQFLLQPDAHIVLENDPQRFFLDHSVTECSRSRVHRIIISVARDHVDTAEFASCGPVTETTDATDEILATLRPIRLATPTFIDRVACGARSL